MQPKATNLRNSGWIPNQNEHSDFRPQRRLRALAPGLLLMSALVLSGLLAGCSSSGQANPQGPTSVSVAEVACKQFDETDEFTGRLEAVNTVEVRPRVSGYLERSEEHTSELQSRLHLVCR